MPLKRHQRYLNWMSTVSKETGLKYLQWQITLHGGGPGKMMPDYPRREFLSGLARAGCVGTLFEYSRRRDGAKADDAVRVLKKYYQDPHPLSLKPSRRRRGAAARPGRANRTTPVRRPVKALPPIPAERVRKLVIEGVAAGRRHMTTIVMGKRSMIGRVVGADEGGIRVKVQTVTIRVAWDRIPEQSLQSLGRNYLGKD